jgi:glycosyltransferase involved in cell wall biosynthesis
MKRLVSVVVAVYNGEKTLKMTIDSILSQTYKDIELMIVDDGSTDSSDAIIKAYNDPRIRVFSQKNSGSPAAPRNMGIKNAKGYLIAFCDQDDIWYPEKLAEQIGAYDSFREKESVGIIVCSAYLIDYSGKRIGQNILSFNGFLPKEVAYPKMLSGNFITSCSSVVPRDVISVVGSLDEELRGVDDYDFWLRITEKYGIIGIKGSLCAWRQDNESLSANKTKQYIETEKIFTKLADKTEEIRYGHGKNIFRIVISSLLGRDFENAEKYLEKVNDYPLSAKTKIIVRIAAFSQTIGYIFVSFLKLIGLVSL